jgi:L-ribulose-5-phosphate 3-epimerase
MSKVKIGICLEPLGLPLRRALQEAGQLGVTGVVIDAAGDLAPGKLSQTGRRELRHLLRTYNLEFTALRCPLRRGLDEADNQEGRIDHVKEVLSLSYDLGPRVVVVQAGKVPEKDDSPRAGLMRDALAALGAHGDRIGARLALETGLESGEVLAAYLDRFDSGSLGVNLDPANLVMGGFNPYESTRALHQRIVHAHAKDARKAGANRTAQETVLGRGDIDWMFFAELLDEIGYHGWLMVQRETGASRRQDIATGVAFLRRVFGGG